jgi:diguanylate cyclase (GGDEF)-like protein/PAS domain S-box-containing protein
LVAAVPFGSLRGRRADQIRDGILAHERSTMPVRLLHACFGLWIVALAACFYGFPALGMYLWAAIGLSGAAAVVVGVRLHRPSRRLPWYLLTAVLVSFTAGDTTYNVLTDFLGVQNPFPSLADGFYLLVYPMLAGALLIFIRARSGGDNRAALLDALVPTAGLGLLSWVFLIAPYVHDGELNLIEKLTSVAYPLGDVLALAMVLRLLTAPGRKPASIAILVAGVASLLVTDVVYGLRQLDGTWAVGGPTDLGWVFFYATVGLSALHPSMTRLTDGTGGPAVRIPAGGRRIAAMSFASLIAPVVLLVEDIRGGVRDAPMIAAACALMFLLVMARVAGLLRLQRDTAARERALRMAGTTLVAAANEREAAVALRSAVADLVPDGEAYCFHMVAEDAATDAVTAIAGLRRIAVADLPPTIAAELGGFEWALYTEVIMAGAAKDGPARRKQAYLTAAPATLTDLAQTFDALVAQGAMAIERIGLTAEVNRRSNEDYFRTLIQSTADVILIVGDDELIRYASPSAFTVFGHAELVGTPLHALIAGVDHGGLAELLDRVRAGGDGVDGIDLTAARADDRLLQVECSGRDLRDDPTVGGLVLTVRDVTERRRLEKDLAHQAFHDALTGLANRALFLNRLQHAAVRAKKTEGLIAVLFVDLDDFKEVNDTLGHAVGDLLLAAVGRRIADVVGPTSTVARTGGDEFAVLLERLHSPRDADEIAARIVTALSGPLEVSDGAGGYHQVSGASSVGAATSADAADTGELQRHADIAMYGAKAAGKNTWQHYQAELHTLMLQRVELRAALHDSVVGDQMRLRFQPIVELAGENVVGFEALVRWEHPTRGLIGPDEFIDAAEENGSIVAIGSWVLGEALRTFVGWRTSLPDSGLRYVSVNVSPRQFRTPGFVELVRGALADAGARPEWLLLEITESLVLHDADQVWSDLKELRSLGVRIAIDDFGTGYSSLSYLRQMPVDVLKIDKSFIDDVLHSSQQLALVEAIVHLATVLRLDVVAEGIENREHLEILQGLACPYGQGYLFSRPVPADECTQWLLARSAALSV